MATVRRANSGDLPAIVDALDRALVDDPFVRWLARPRARARGRRAYVRLMAEKIAARRGVIDVALDGDAVVGAALWAPPHTFDLGLLETIFLLPAILGVVGASRLFSVADALAAVEASRPPEPRWLLTLIGTVPGQRRRGVGSELMERGLSRCERDGAPVVLETTHEPNLRFYERFDFEVSARRTLSPRGPTSWTLVRDG